MKQADLSYTINDIRELNNKNRIVWKEHALHRLEQRRILQREVREALRTGEIIEVYPSDRPFPSCLVFGITLNKRRLHIVCSIDCELLYIITAYEPNTIKWENDYKTRKEC